MTVPMSAGPSGLFYQKLAESKASGFGVIHWMTRPWDLFFASHIRQVFETTRNEPLRATCEQMGGRAMGEYFYRWITEAPQFGRETGDYFIDRVLTNVPGVVAGCRERLKLLREATGEQADYFRGLEQFIASFYETHDLFQRSQAALAKNDVGQARQLMLQCRPEPVIEQFAKFSSVGGITRGEQGLLVALNLRWFTHLVSHRQALGLEPVRIKFGPTQHDRLAQYRGTFTFYLDADRKTWEVWGQEETGARAFMNPEAIQELARTGIEIDKPLNFTVHPIMAMDSRKGGRPSLLPVGNYNLRLFISGAEAYDITVQGKRYRADRLEWSCPVALAKPGVLDVTLAPVKGTIRVCGVILEPIGAAPAMATAQIAPGVVGDGVHDDTDGLQALLDSGRPEVRFPDPPVRLAISRTLKIHSRQSLVLSPATVIRLLPKSNTVMITNDDHDRGNTNICLIGGIWDMDNEKQDLCSYHRDRNWHGEYRSNAYIGVLMRFNNVTDLTLRGLTLKDPESYGTQLGNLNRFTIEDITFDYNLKRGNMDGIHVHGNSRHGRIANLKGTTNDDAVALNADDAGIFEMCRGPIEDIAVDGVSAKDGYTAVRLLSAGSPVRRIRLANIFGTYRYNVVSFTNHKVHPGSESTFEDIFLDGLFCAKSSMGLKFDPAKPGNSSFSLIWIDVPAVVSGLTVTNLCRTETLWPAATLFVEPGATIKSLQLTQASLLNRTPGPLDLLVNRGAIDSLSMNQVRLEASEGPARGAVVRNSGRIRERYLQQVSAVNTTGEVVEEQGRK